MVKQIQDAFVSDKTFDKKLGKQGGHTCCGSKTRWRHLFSCKYSCRNFKDDLSDLKDI